LVGLNTNPDIREIITEEIVSKERDSWADQELKNSFWTSITTAEKIILQTKALALNRHQCQRIVAGAKIIVTTTKIMVSQAETISLK
jgi:hypothetical protein